MPPTISVVLSVRDGERHLRASIDSILGQTFDDFEFIVIDDGSTDATKAILDGYGDRRIVRLHNPVNIGLTRSLNRGLDIVQGRYLARQDADDVSAPDRFARQLEYVRHHPELGLLGTAWRAIDAQGRPGAVSRQPTDDVGIRWQMHFFNAFCHTSVMVRRGLFEDGNRLRYDETLPFAQDYDLWTHLVERAKAANLPEPLVDLRFHDESVSALRGTDQWRIANGISHRRLAALLPDDPPSKDEVSRLRGWFYGLPEGLSAGELRLARVYLTALDLFAREWPGNEAFFSRQRQNWVDRLLDASPSDGALARMSLVAWLTCHAPTAVLRNVARRTVRGRPPGSRRTAAHQ